MLAEVADLGVAAEGALAFLKLHHAGEDFNERGLAGAVWSNEGDPLTALDEEIEVAVNDMVAICHLDSLKHSGALSAAFGLGDSETEGFLRRFGALDFFHPLDLLQLALRLGCFGGNGTEAVGEFLQAGDFLLLVFVGSGLDLVVALPLLHGGGIVSLVVDELGIRDFVNAVDEGIHELQIVGDQQKRTGAGLQILLQPEKREEIQVVRRFIQQQQVWLHNQKSCQVRTHHPSAAEFACGTTPIGFAIAEAGEHFFGLRLDMRTTERLVFGVCLKVFRAFDISGPLEGCELFFERLKLSCTTAGDVESCLGMDSLCFLRQVAEGRPFIALNRPIIRLIRFQNERKKRGLAGAVRPNQSDALAIVDLHVGFFEKESAAVGFFEISNGKHVSGSSVQILKRTMQKNGRSPVP